MVKFSDEKLKEVQRIISFYPEGKQKSAVIPVLHLAQKEFGGWLSVETMDYVASLLVQVLGDAVSLPICH